MAWWDQCIDAQVTAGAKYIVRLFMSHSAYESVESIKKWCDYFNEAGTKCNAKGIRLGYHNHSNEFTTVFGDTVHVRELNIGDYPCQEMFNLFDKMNYSGWIFLEVRTEHADGIAAMKEQIEVFRQIFFC